MRKAPQRKAKRQLNSRKASVNKARRKRRLALHALRNKRQLAAAWRRGAQLAKMAKAGISVILAAAAYWRPAIMAALMSQLAGAAVRSAKCRNIENR
jgi:hypothetical protein